MTVADEPALTEHPVTVISAAYQDHAASSYAVARRVTRDHELATEAVQDAFLCLWRTQANYRPDRGEIGPFLHTIVHRRAVDLVRRNVRYPKPIAIHLMVEELRAVDVCPEESVCRTEAADRVRTAVMALPPHRRNPLVLYYYFGLTQSEIAGRLGLPLGTVKTRMLAARRELRTSLAEGKRLVPPQPTSSGQQANIQRPVVVAVRGASSIICSR